MFSRMHRGPKLRKRPQQGRRRLHGGTFGVPLLLAAALAAVAGCSAELLHLGQASLTVHFSYPGAAGEPVGALRFDAGALNDADSIDFGLIVVEEAAVRAGDSGYPSQLLDDVDPDSTALLETRSTGSYRSVGFSLTPGSTVARSVDRLTAGRSYLVLVRATPFDGGVPGVPIYGYAPEIAVRAGEDAAVGITLNRSYTEVVQFLVAGYGVVPEEGVLVEIDLTDPNAPVVGFTGAQPALNRAAGTPETMTVTATAGFATYSWSLNGAALGETTNELLVDSDGMPLGTHTVDLIVTDADGNPFSAGFTFTVVEE